jgi:hypothetical protein
LKLYAENPLEALSMAIDPRNRAFANEIKVLPPDTDASVLREIAQRHGLAQEGESSAAAPITGSRVEEIIEDTGAREGEALANTGAREEASGVGSKKEASPADGKAEELPKAA